jgi:Helix-turn-helix.
MKGGDILSYDYRKLRGKIKEVCGTQDAFSEKLGIGRVSLSQRLNNQLEFSQDEMLKSCDILGIQMEDLPSYFFTTNV